MAFKMRSGNKPAFKKMGGGNSPMKEGLGKWSTWTGDRQKFIGDEIEARRKKFALMDAADAKAKSGEGDNGDDNKKDTGTNNTTETNNKPGRVEHALGDENLKKYVKQEKGSTEGDVYTPGKQELSSYAEAWKDPRFTVSEDGKTKTAPKELGGRTYPNTPEGFKQYETDSEQWWKDEQAKKDKGLNIDSQTGKQSTHQVWN